MADQEFSSPGEHMASSGTSPDIYGGVAFRDPNRQNWDNSIVTVGQAPVYYANDYGNGKVFDDHHFNNVRSFRDYDVTLSDFYAPYMKYNSDMFNNARDYDMMMSNTAIVRQMQDLKNAGINPLYAGRLGGAEYKGVSAPYVSINPGSTLGSMYSADLNYNARMSEIAKDYDISEKELKFKAEMVSSIIEQNLEIAGINRQTLLDVADKNNEATAQIKTIIQEMQNEVTYNTVEDKLDTEKEIATDKNNAQIITAGIAAIALIASKVLGDKFKGFGSGSSSSNFGSSSQFNDNISRDTYNDMFKKGMLGAEAVAGLGLSIAGLGLIPIF